MDENPMVQATGINKMNHKAYRPSDFSNHNMFAQYNKDKGITSSQTNTKNRNFSMLTNNYTDTVSGSVLTTLSVKCKVQYVF